MKYSQILKHVYMYHYMVSYKYLQILTSPMFFFSYQVFAALIELYFIAYILWTHQTRQ